MTSDRPYRQAMSDEQAQAEIAAGAGTQFCPTAAQTLLRVLSSEPHSPDPATHA